MDIRKNEFKKAVTSPIIIGLLVLFIVFNSIIIFQNSYFKDELKVLNKIVDKFDYKIDDKMEANFKNYYDTQLKKLNEIINKKTSKKYESVSEFYEEQNYYIEDTYNKEEIEFIKELGIVEAYFYTMEDIDEVYSKVDIMGIAEGEIKKYGLSGKAADTVRNQYERFNERYSQLIENGEHKNLFFLGKVYGMHSLLFEILFKTILFEIIILVVFITSYLVNYEFDNNTQTIIYSTKRGRNLVKDKLYVSIFANILVATVILITGLGLYFIIFDYSRLWNVPISSYFNTDKNFIYMSWWNMSFVQYLFSGIGLIYAITLLFTGISFIIARFIKNNYIVFSVFAIIFGLALTTSIAPTNSNAIFIKSFTPFWLIMNPFIWFMEGGAFSTFKYYELLTVGIWTILLLALSVLSIKRFKRQDI